MTSEPLRIWKRRVECKLHQVGLEGGDDYLERLFSESPETRSWFDDDMGPSQTDYAAAYAT